MVARGSRTRAGTGARVGVLADESEAWPSDGVLSLVGFEYDLVGPDSPVDAPSRVEWLGRMPEGYSPQPYEQLAAVLERMGHDAAARRIRIERQRQRRRYGQLPRYHRGWSWLLDVTIRYGWEPWRAVIGGVAVAALGALIFWLAGRGGVMERVDADSFAAFQPVVYSLDSFIPFVDLRQEGGWLPNTSIDWGWPTMVYLWLHIALGWVLSTLTALSFTSVVRQR